VSLAHAVLIGTLLLLPIGALLGWPRRFVSVGRQEQDRDALQAVPRWYTALLMATAAVFVAAILLRGLSLQHNIESLTLLALVSVCLWKAPVHPLAGPLAYCLLSYTFGRDDTVTRTLMDLHGTTWVAAMSLVAAVVRSGGRLPVHRNPLVWGVSLFAAWVALSTITAAVIGRGVSPDLIHRATRYAEVVTLFFVASSARPTLVSLRLVLLVLAIALVIRQTLLTSYWLFEQNLAMVAVVAVPLALALAVTRPFGRVQIPLAVSALYLTGMILFVENRGAIVGLAVACLALWPLARRRWLGLLVLVCLGPLAGYLAWQAGLLDRFNEVYADGGFVGSAAERIEIWTAGLQTVRDHPILGAGPGHFVDAVSESTAGRIWLNAHSSPVELVVELGVPGLVLYGVLLLSALVVLVGIARRDRRDWPRTVAAGLLGSLGAHVGAGLFLSNPSLALTWIFLGVAAGLHRPPGTVPQSAISSGEQRGLTEPDSVPSR
jgi:O-antigen ligase